MKKRLFDIMFSIILIILLFPLFLIIGLMVYIDVKGPFFRQPRIGLNEKKFKIFKFKSMKDVNHSKGLVTNEDRITSLGRFLRRSSIDELPCLLNIFKGDMSFVGPRPLLVEYLPYYKEKHKARHNVRPGLTGLAQIRGRNNTSWEDRLDNDIEYIENRSFLLDMKILFLTFSKVIKKEGVESTVDLSIIRLDQDKNYSK